VTVSERPRPGDADFVDEREATGRRGYSWPPFEEGHELSLRHGAHSERKLAPIAGRLEVGILLSAPWLSRPSFRAATVAWAWSEAQCIVFREWFGELGLFDDDGAPRPGLQNWDRCEARASKLRARLSLDPSALASLIGKLASAEAAGGPRAQAEVEAIQREINSLDEEIADEMARRELEA
jgi:hypothetical protein